MKNTTHHQFTVAMKTAAVVAPFIIIVGAVVASLPIIATGCFLMLSGIAIATLAE